MDSSFTTEMLKYELESITAPGRVITDEAEIQAQSLDVWWVTRYWKFSKYDFPAPDAIIFPENREEVVGIVRFCNEHKIPCIPRGGGAGDSGGTVPVKGGIVVDMKRMDKILEINRLSLTARVQTGIIQKHLEEQLNRQGFTMNHFPASINTSTLGGFISTNGTGVLSSRYGKVSDMVHQLEIVLPTGKILKTLPVRLHSSGPDYSRLFFGAEGTLGIVTEALCKIYHLPEKRLFGAYLLPGLSEGIEAGRIIMVKQLAPSLMRLYDETDTKNILKKQYKIDYEGAVLILGFDGLEKIVNAQFETAHEILTGAGGRDLGEEPGKNWWKNRCRSYYPPNDYIAYPWMTAVTDTIAPYEKIERIYREMKKVVEEGFSRWGALFQAHFSHWYDWGTGIYPTFVLKEYPADKQEALALYNRILDAAVGISLKEGGVINEHHGIGMRLGRFMKEAYGRDYSFAASIKKALDPNNIMNPGKLGLGV